MSTLDRCKKLISQINALNKTETEELFRILHKTCQYTANNNGVFINLSWLPLSVLEKIEQFIEFCSRSSFALEQRENDCTRLVTSINSHVEPENIVIDPEGGGTLLSHAISPKGKTNKTNKTISETDIVPLEDTDSSDADDTTTTTGEPAIVRRVSSSMRFYLLKKRFAKPPPPQQGFLNNLESEPYLCT